jgi:hypothetical protein
VGNGWELFVLTFASLKTLARCYACSAARYANQRGAPLIQNEASSRQKLRLRRGVFHGHGNCRGHSVAVHTNSRASRSAISVRPTSLPSTKRTAHRRLLVRHFPCFSRLGALVQAHGTSLNSTGPDAINSFRRCRAFLPRARSALLTYRRRLHVSGVSKPTRR